MVEISIAGFPLPARLPPKETDRVIKEDWVMVRDNERVYARLTEYSFVLSRDEKGVSIVRAVQLENATVAKGKKNGNAALVVADVNGKCLIGLHNHGVAQEWFSAIKSAIIIAYGMKFEPETIMTLRPIK